VINNTKQNVLTLTLHDIKTKNIRKVIDYIKLTDLSHHNKMQISVDGYNSDKRELFEIKEVKDFFKKLSKRYNQWLSPLISIDTIRLVLMCILHNTYNDIPAQTSHGKVYSNIKEKDWLKLVSKWIDNSKYGKDFSSHIAFDVFPNICPEKNFTTKNQSYMLLSEMIERGYDTSKKIISHNFCGVKVYSFGENEIFIKAYTKKDGLFKTFDFNINNPVLEVLSSVEEFKSSFDKEINKVISYMEN